MGDTYDSYDVATNHLGLEKLSDRRSKICLNFARQCEKHPKCSNWFQTADEVIQPSINTISDKTMLQTKYTPVHLQN